MLLQRGEGWCDCRECSRGRSSLLCQGSAMENHMLLCERHISSLKACKAKSLRHVAVVTSLPCLTGGGAESCRQGKGRQGEQQARSCQNRTLSVHGDSIDICAHPATNRFSKPSDLECLVLTRGFLGYF